MTSADRADVHHAEPAAPRPLLLAANQPAQFYRGGASIAALRGMPAPAEFGPEDWVASTTSLFGKAPAGLSVLPDGRLLRDAVADDPHRWLGPEHTAALGADTGLLVKLLDAGQRLPVHCHPSNAFAQRHLGCRHGKTEAWVVIGTSGDNPTVYAGFADHVDERTIAGWVSTQDSGAMLGALNPMPVRPGDTVFVPAGLPHAIGPGVFIAELQQPTDFSVTLEWRGFLRDADAGHLGLGYDTALGCVDRSGWRGSRLDSLVRHTAEHGDAVVPLFGWQAEEFFRAERLHPHARTVELEPSLSVLIVLEGTGRLRSEHGGELALRRGHTAVVPFAAGASTLEGDLVAIRCRPPHPSVLPGGPRGSGAPDPAADSGGSTPRSATSPGSADPSGGATGRPSEGGSR